MILRSIHLVNRWGGIKAFRMERRICNRGQPNTFLSLMPNSLATLAVVLLDQRAFSALLMIIGSLLAPM
jgi:hypothetical protein